MKILLDGLYGYLSGEIEASIDKVKNKTDIIAGVAKTSGQDGEMVEVVAPDLNEGGI